MTLVDYEILADFRSEEWYEKCQEWLIVAGGRRLWEKDMRWCTNQLKVLL